MWEVGLDYYGSRIVDLPRSGHRVLDLGCGPGQWSAAALREGMWVVGCDNRISERALGLARQTRGFALVKANAPALPFHDDSFDLVLCHLVLPYVPVEASMAEVTRVLRPGGVFNGVCHGPGYYVLQAWREVRSRPRSTIRRLLVLAYTVVHRVAALSNYHYETFQSPKRFRALLRHLGYEILSLELGGHPTMPENSLGPLPVFFEFTARKRSISPLGT